MEINEKLKMYRLDAHLSQQELGNKVGVSQQQIAQWEQGKRKPKIETLTKLALALNISLSDLVNPNTLSLTNSMIDFFSGSDDIQELDTTDPTTAQEHYLMISFRELNEKGKKKAVDYIDDLKQISDYKAPTIDNN